MNPSFLTFLKHWHKHTNCMPLIMLVTEYEEKATKTIMTQVTYNYCCYEIGIKNGQSLITTFSKKILVNIPIPWLWENVNGLKSNYKNTSWHQVHRYLEKTKRKSTSIKPEGSNELVLL